MSLSLINKGLELIEDDLNIGAKSCAKESKKSVKNLKKQLKSKNSDTLFSTRKVKSAFELYKKETVKDKTLENIDALKKLDSNFKGFAEQKVRRNQLKNWNEKDLKTCLKEKDKPIFTDEDFKKMEKEWQKFT